MRHASRVDVRGFDPNEEKQVEIGVTPTVGDESVARVEGVEAAADAPSYGTFEVTVATGGKNLGLDLDNSSMRPGNRPFSLDFW